MPWSNFSPATRASGCTPPFMPIQSQFDDE
jgi:hypothetical protein